MPLAQVILIHSTNPTTKVMKLLEQLQQLSPLAEAATPGHWSAGYDSEESCYRITAPIGSSEIEVYLCTELDDDDAAFIAAARNVLTPENLTLIIGLLSNMESSFETNRVLVKRLFEIQGILENDLLDDTKLYLISETINPPKIAKR